jgi:hypothetical protein
MSDDDQTLRIALIVWSLVVLPIAVYHRLASQATGEKLDRRQEGLFILLTLRALGIAALLGLERKKRISWRASATPIERTWPAPGASCRECGEMRPRLHDS